MKRTGTLRYARSLCAEEPAGVAPLAPLQGLRTTPPAPDYMVLFRTLEDVEGSHLLAVDETGWKCAHATDVDACSARIVQQTPLAPGANALYPFVLAVQRGDDLRAINSWRELSALLGQVDSLEEAYLHALLHGFSADCSSSSGERAGDDWLMTLRRSTRCGEGTYAVRVKRDGALEVFEASEPNWNAGCVRYAPPKGPNSWLEPDGERR